MLLPVSAMIKSQISITSVAQTIATECHGENSFNVQQNFYQERTPSVFVRSFTSCQANMNGVEVIDLTDMLSDDEDTQMVFSDGRALDIEQELDRQVVMMTPPTDGRKRKYSCGKPMGMVSKVFRCTPSSDIKLRPPQVSSTVDVDKHVNILSYHLFKGDKGDKSLRGISDIIHEGRHGESSAEHSDQVVQEFHNKSYDGNSNVVLDPTREFHSSEACESIDISFAVKHDQEIPSCDCRQTNDVADGNITVVPVLALTTDKPNVLLESIVADEAEGDIYGIFDGRNKRCNDGIPERTTIDNPKVLASLVNTAKVGDIVVKNDDAVLDTTVFVFDATQKLRPYRLAQFFRAFLLLAAIGSAISVHSKARLRSITGDKCPFPSLYVDDGIDQMGRDRCQFN